MTYEMGHHYRHETGPHAPLYKNRKSPFDQQWSIEKSVEYWDSAGVPKSKIQIGIPAYGKIFNTTVAKGSDLKARPEYGDSLAYQPTNFLKMQDLLTKGEDLSALHAIDPTVAAAPDAQCPKAMRITVPDADGPTVRQADLLAAIQD